mgnify:FL=1
MRVEILEAAEWELGEAIAYYEQLEPGLGLRLKDMVREAIEWIALNPEVPRLRASGYRRVNLKVFPYYVAYVLWADAIWILAIAHGRRRPEYWRQRRARVA